MSETYQYKMPHSKEEYEQFIRSYKRLFRIMGMALLLLLFTSYCLIRYIAVKGY